MDANQLAGLSCGGGMDVDEQSGGYSLHTPINEYVGGVKLPASLPSTESDLNCIYLSAYSANRLAGSDAAGFAAPGAATGHRCCASCTIRQEFGNMWRCLTSGKVHICDATCTERIAWGPNEAICRISRKVFPLSEGERTYVRRVLSKRNVRDGEDAHAPAEVPQPFCAPALAPVLQAPGTYGGYKRQRSGSPDSPFCALPINAPANGDMMS